MKLSPLARELYDEIAELTIIDAHEHLPAEEVYLGFEYSGLNMFAGYIWHDLESAGLDSAFKQTMRDSGRDRPVESWWPIIKPHWEQVKNTSYARALRITARDLFGIEEINDSTIGEFAEKVKADNRPGLYRRILQNRCNVRYSITCCDLTHRETNPGLKAIDQIPGIRPSDSSILTEIARATGGDITTLDAAADAIQGVMRCHLADGDVGFKMLISDYPDWDQRAAEEEFAYALAHPQDTRPLPNLRGFLFDKALDVAAEADVPVAVHTGYWGDFRDLDPKRMYSFLGRRGDVRFDMFHLGMPMVRDAALIGKNVPNVTLNLCWCPVISQLQTTRMLGEIIDLVPLNKVTAFGADYRACVQKVYGHLVMAREAVASVLADRIDAGDFDREYAMHIAKMWFHDNPSRIYRLNS